MRNLVVLLFIAILLALFPGTVNPLQAQSAPLTCPEIVQAALTALEANCTGVGRNTACYANTLVESSFTQPVADGFFSQPADLADITTLSSLITAPMDTANDIWGIALMNLQANLPGTLPGQSVTMLLMGDAVVANAVPESAAALPFPPVDVTTLSAAEVRTLPLSDAALAGVTSAAETLAADARTSDNLWVRVVVPAETPYGGWIASAALGGFDLAQLPVVDADTRTPMQAFVFRTGIGAPVCAEAPNSVVVQGPSNTQVVVNVNGANLTIGSTVRLSSVAGAPQAIIDLLDLPDDVADQLNDASRENGGSCGVMAMNVLSGSVEVNEGNAILPAGNTAYAVACEDNSQNPESTPEPGAPPEIPNINFSSDWGAFGPMDEEELLALLPLEQVGDSVLNYPIVLPDPDNIQPPITVTPTPQPGFAGVFPPAATSTPVITTTPTPNPTELPGRGLSTFITANPAANNQIAPVTQPLAVPLSVQVTDPYGDPSVSVPVTFSAPASGPSGVFTATGTNTQTVMTDQSGNAVASVFTANTNAGSYTITASAPQDVGFFASAPGKSSFGKPASRQATLIASFNVVNAPGSPSLISAAPGGTNLTATVATTYAGLPAVLITDSFNNPIPFVPVTFTAQTGGSGATGLFSGSPVASSATGSDGIASAPFLTANTIAGAFQIAATSSAGTVNLGMTNLPDVPASLTATFGGGQYATVGTAFANYLIGLVTDIYGNGVPGVDVTFTAPASGPGAGFLGSGTNSELITTDSAGFATSSAVIANTTSGSYSVAATVGALNASFSLTNTAGAPDAMTIINGDGQSATLNTAFANALSVHVVDGYNNPVAGASVIFTAPPSGPGGSFGGPNIVTTDGSGNASAPTFSANNTTGAYSVSATSGAASASFNLTNLNPVPALTALSPSSVVAGSGGFTLTLTGTGFVPGMQVIWSGQANLPATVNLPTSATANIPAGYVDFAGTPSVSLINPGPGGGSSGALTLTVTPSTTVTSLADSGAGSLRQVIADAPANSTITFGVTGTITLTSGVINIGQNLTLNGPGANLLTISGNNTSRIFDVYASVLNLNNMRLTAGRASGPGGEDGGAIYVFSGASLNVNTVQFDNHNASGNPCCEKGGAIFSQGVTVTITNSSFLNNSAVQSGSAITIWPTATSLSITNSCLLNNTGAGNYAVDSGVTTTISGNWWGDPGGPGANGVNNSYPTDSAPASGPIGGVPGC